MAMKWIYTAIIVEKTSTHPDVSTCSFENKDDAMTYLLGEIREDGGSKDDEETIKNELEEQGFYETFSKGYYLEEATFTKKNKKV